MNSSRGRPPDLPRLFSVGEKMFHIQCLLKRGLRLQTVWIPENYAKVGKFLTLKESPGWEVIKKYSKMKSTEVKERSQDFKHQRKASDI